MHAWMLYETIVKQTVNEPANPDVVIACHAHCTVLVNIPCTWIPCMCITMHLLCWPWIPCMCNVWMYITMHPLHLLACMYCPCIPCMCNSETHSPTALPMHPMHMNPMNVYHHAPTVLTMNPMHVQCMNVYHHAPTAFPKTPMHVQCINVYYHAPTAFIGMHVLPMHHTITHCIANASHAQAMQ